MTHKLSVVIPTHNRRQALQRLLRTLASQNFPHDQLEVLVVADGCSDDTVAVVGAETYPFALRVFEQQPGRGPGIARNLGASHAAGETLLFIDDDIEPFPHMLATHARLHAKDDDLAVIGAPVPVRIEPMTFQRLAAWAWWEQQFEAMSKPGHRFRYTEFFTGVFSVSASSYRRAGGFDDFFAECHEDSELGLKLLRNGTHVVFSREAGGMHHEVRDLAQLLERKRAEGKADVRLAQRYPELLPILRIGSPLPPLLNPFGLVRRLASSAVPAGVVLALGKLFVDLVERLRARRVWWQLHGALLYFAYWRGATREAGGAAQIRELVRTHRQHTADTRTVAEIDLSEELANAEQRLDRERPDALRVHKSGVLLGELPLRPGTERLRGLHLRPILARELSVAVLYAVAPELFMRQ